MIKYIKNNLWGNIISNVARSSNVTTITTSSAHGLSVNDIIKIDCNDNTYDVNKVLVISIPTSTSFTYANIGDDETQKSATGYVGKWVKYCGVQLVPGEWYEIDNYESELWRIEASEGSLGTAISNGDIKVKIDSNEISDNSQGKESFINDVPRLQLISLQGNSKSFLEATETTWESMAFFIFPGYNNYGVPEAIYVGYQIVNGDESNYGALRVINRSVDPPTLIASKSNLIDSDIDIRSLGTLSNIPASVGLFEV